MDWGLAYDPAPYRNRTDEELDINHLSMSHRVNQQRGQSGQLGKVRRGDRRTVVEKETDRNMRSIDKTLAAEFRRREREREVLVV